MPTINILNKSPPEKQPTSITTVINEDLNDLDRKFQSKKFKAATKKVFT